MLRLIRRSTRLISTPRNRHVYFGKCAVGVATGAGFGLISTQWSLKEDACRRLEDQMCIWQGLLTPYEAQRTHAVHVEQLLSDEDIADFMRQVREVQQHGLVGMERRDRHGVQDADGCWRTTYLHTDGIFRSKFDALHQKLRRAIFEIDAKHWRVLDSRDASRLNFRTVEYHEYESQGRLAATKHYDAGSLITLDIMLADPGNDFKGGELVMPQPTGEATAINLKKGDAALFLSHKFHNVQPVHQGRRTVLVLELWDGPEPTCPHRCQTLGFCSTSAQRFRLPGLTHLLSSVGMRLAS